VDRVDADNNTWADIDQGSPPETPLDIDIAILDTGIDGSHTDLNIYAAGSKNFVTGLPDSAWHDGHGHGTHVAGSAAAVDNDFGVTGVAPGARLWALKVLDDEGSGSVADALAAVEYVTAHADEIEVVNMSFGEYGPSTAFRQAVQNAVAKGVVFVAAAGNDARDIFGSDGVFDTSDDFFPAAYPEVLTVSAMTDHDGQPGGTGGDWIIRLIYGEDDSFAFYSNYSTSEAPGNPVTSPGAGIDLLAPGTQIYSTETGGGYSLKDGTSMASPHAAGLAALWIVEHSWDVDGDGLVDYGDINGDGVRNEADVYAVRQSLINRGKNQNDSTYGLAFGGDPDANRERIGWAGAVTSNDAPVASVESDSTEIDTPITLNVLANDSDPNGDPLWVAIQTSPANGTVVVNADHTVLYTPGSGFEGNDQFAYVAHDGVDASAVTTVSIQVGAGNLPPVADAGGPYTVDEGGSISLDASGSYDPDGTIASYAWDLDNDGEYDDATGISPDFSAAVLDDSGAIPIGLRVTDAEGSEGFDAGTITVANVAPSLADLRANTFLAGETVTLSGEITDPGTLDTFTLTVDWGDGSAVDVFHYPAATSAFSETHTFLSGGASPFTIELDLEDDDLGASHRSITGAYLEATENDDAITFSTGTQHSVTINGAAPLTFDPSQVVLVHIDGLGGADAITISGTDQNEIVALQPGSADVVGKSYEVQATSIETITVDAGAGHDEATMVGSVDSNRLHSYPGQATLTDSIRSYRFDVEAAEDVTVNAPEDGRDYAYLYDRPGEDNLEADPGQAIFTRGVATADETVTTVLGFQRVYAYATQGDNDSATLTGADTTRNRFYGYADYSILTESRRAFYFYARGFDAVTANSPGDGYTYAYLHDSSGTDTFAATPASATMVRAEPWSETTANGFMRIYAYSTRGGDDTAQLTGSATGGNYYRGYPTYSTLTDSLQTFYHYARGFRTVTAIGAQGAAATSDRAYLYDSTGNDTFTGAFFDGDKYQGGSLTDASAIAAGTYENLVKFFDLIYARSSDSGTDDTIEVTDESLLAYNLIRSGTWDS
jgi:hypothetical protein